MVYEAKGDYLHAEPSYLRALTIREKALGADHPDIAISLNRLASLYGAKGEYARAEVLTRRELAIREKALGPDHPDIAISLSNLARLCWTRGDYALAEPLYQRALEIRRKALGADHPDVAVSLNNLASLYWAKGDYARAEELEQRALAIREEALGRDHPDVAVSLNNLGRLYWTNGEYARAKSLYQRALEIEQKALGPDHPEVARSLNDLAMLYGDMGDFTRAEQFMLHALAISKKALGPDHPDVARSLVGLARLYTAEGDYERAQSLSLHALAIFERVLGPDNPDVASVLNTLGDFYQSKGDHAQSEPLYVRALAIRRKMLGPDHPDVATSLNSLAMLHYDEGDNSRAEPLLEAALAIRKRALGPDHPDVAKSLNDLAGVCRDTGDYERAEPLYQRAIEIRLGALGPDHPDVATSLNGLAELYWAKRDYARAAKFYQEGNDARERFLVRQLASGSEKQRRALLAVSMGGADASISLAVSTGRADAARVALAAVLRRKGRAIDAMADSTLAVRRHLDRDDQQLLDELASLRSELAMRTLAGPGKVSAEAHRAELAKLAAREEELEVGISAKSAAFRATERPITVEAVQSAVPLGAALVEWTVYRPFRAAAKPAERWGSPRFAVAILTQGADPQWIDLGDAAAVEKAVAALRRTLGSPAEDPKAAARALEAMVFAPVRARLGPIRWAFLSPDSALNQVPLGALVDDEGEYLVERWGLSYLTSGRDLLRLGHRAAPRAGAVVMGDPAFDWIDHGSADSALLSVETATLHFPPLPGTAREARSVGALLDGATVLLGEAATKAALKALHGPRVLHVATHGFVLGAQQQPTSSSTDLGAVLERGNPRSSLLENPLLRSGLALAGANAHGMGGGDGILTALEASMLDLDGTEVVTLSASESALGETTPGEGVGGLRPALVLAGSETQVTTLWKVDDEATTSLMTAYYQRLVEGAGRAEAMRQAQLVMLAEPRRSHPYYWAAFLVSGDPSTLAGKLQAPTLTKVAPSARGCACEAAGGAGDQAGGAMMFTGVSLVLAWVRSKGRRARKVAAKHSNFPRPAQDPTPAAIFAQAYGIARVARSHPAGIAMVVLVACAGVPPRIARNADAVKGETSAAWPRRALLIGNGKYQNIRTLTNPAHDAEVLKDALVHLGFESVSKQVDLDRDGLEGAVNDFVKMLAPHDAAVVFYAGHGVEIGGTNYLLPIDFHAKNAADAKGEGYALDRLLERLDERNGGPNVVLLDACRDDPFSKEWLGDRPRGFVPLPGARAGTSVWFSTGFGQVASDGDGENSPFTMALIDALRERAREDMMQLFFAVKEHVKKTTNQQQEPFFFTSIQQDFRFSPNVALVQSPVLQPTVTKPLGPSSRALVIGISHYEDPAFSTLRVNAQSDVRVMSRAFRALG